MRQSLRRIATTVWALWFVLLVSEPALLHVCPMHDGAASSAGQHGSHVMPTSAAASHDAHASHADHTAMAVVGAPDDTPDENGSHGCTCLGDCAATAAIVVAEAPRWGWLAGVVEVEARPIVDVEAPRALVDHLLPFANGPPPAVRA